MRLSTFILAHQEKILGEWDDFAATMLPTAAGMSQAAIRDHAAEILRAIAKDLAQSQTPLQQAEKSRGKAPVLFDAPETAAQTHALLRARSGFDINQMAGEYRALRASVLKLWLADSTPSMADLQDVIRFNEAIDQSLAESIAHFSKELERSRNLLLGMLGHDMRNPLGVVILTAQHLSKLDAGAAVSKAAASLISSGARLRALLDDLVDFNRTNLGVGIKIARTEVNLERVFAEQLELAGVNYLGRQDSWRRPVRAALRTPAPG